jgi:hypothetical protein
LIAVDHLRPPSVSEPEAMAYKEWLHLCVFDHARDGVGLVNVSLQGPPREARARATGLGLFHDPSLGWLGNLEVRDALEARVGAASIGLGEVAIGVDRGSGAVSASVRQPRDLLQATLAARPASRSLRVGQRAPLGSGWISWYAVPRMGIEGEVRLAGERRGLERASAYYDHNWGRWRWGEEVAWEWGCFMAPAPAPSLVFTRTCDREHRRFGTPTLTVMAGDWRRTFTGPAVVVSDRRRPPEAGFRRLPGAMAALHQGRARPWLPDRVCIEAADGHDALRIEFEARAAAQLISADPFVRGYGFIHEIVGGFRASGLVGGTPLSMEGLAIFEYAT